LRRLIGKQIELITVLDPEAGRVRADPAQLRQVRSEAREAGK
jgi:hypothetical protein